MPSIVEVVWQDHALHREYAGQGLSLQRSVGYLVADKRKSVKIAMTITTDDGAAPVPTDVLVVDKRMLVEMKKVT